MKATTKKVLIGVAIAVPVLGWIGASTSTDDPKTEVAAAVSTDAPSVSSTDAPTTAPSTTSTPVPEVNSEFALNAEWAAASTGKPEAMVAAFQAVSDAAESGDMVDVMVACAAMRGPAIDFGTGTPDTVAGRHAKRASELYVQAADACTEGDFDATISFLEAASPELHASTEALEASTPGS